MYMYMYVTHTSWETNNTAKKRETTSNKIIHIAQGMVYGKC